MAFEQRFSQGPQRTMHDNHRRFGMNHHRTRQRFGYNSQHEQVEGHQPPRSNSNYPNTNVLTTNINNTNRRYDARMNTNANRYYKPNTNQYNTNYDRDTIPNDRDMDSNYSQNVCDMSNRSYLSEENLRKLTESQSYDIATKQTDYIPCESENNDLYNPIHASALSSNEDDDLGTTHRRINEDKCLQKHDDIGRPYRQIDEDKHLQKRPNIQQNTKQTMNKCSTRIDYAEHEDIDNVLAQLQDITNSVDLLTTTISNHASESEMMQKRVKCLEQNKIYSPPQKEGLYSEHKAKQNRETASNKVARPRMVGRKRKYDDVMKQNKNGYHYNENKKRRLHGQFNG